MSVIGEKFYDADGKEFTCVKEDARAITVRYEAEWFGWKPDHELWKRKLTNKYGEQFYTEAQNLVRRRAAINRKRLLDLVATLRDDQVDKVLAGFFQPVK